jgi:hypothetical protein
MSSLAPRADSSAHVRKDKEIQVKLTKAQQRKRSGLIAAGTRLSKSLVERLKREGW